MLIQLLQKQQRGSEHLFDEDVPVVDGRAGTRKKHKQVSI